MIDSLYRPMELLLNLVWVAMALAAFCTLLRNRRVASQLPQVPYGKALLALACVLVLLFPVVSASDDLHPAQAVLEEATKRVQQLSAPLHHIQSVSDGGIILYLLATYLLFALLALQVWKPIAQEAMVIHRERLPRAGRSPPSF
ncbi:MAG: hypothetical protein WBS19_17280 [Candidatus Korobacteraceae bacterium]